MKILQLSFKNINSLRGEHHVDFTQSPFVQNNLFAITGPTGSGKTSLLDAISLALFNQVPRLGKLSTTEVIKKGAILTRNQTDAYAQVTYSCESGIFASRWEISTARTGNLRDYEMRIISLKEDKTLDLKKSEVPNHNEKLIGLNYEQFIKSVVLAQGEFAKFLQVNKKDRGALLEKITGTGIYRQLGQLAYRKYGELEKQIQNQKEKINTFSEQLISDEVFKHKKKEAAEKRNLKKRIAKKIDDLKEQIRIKEQSQAILKNLVETENKLNEHNLKLENFNKEKGLALKKHLALQATVTEINEEKNLSVRLGDITKKIDSNQNSIQQNQKEWQENQNLFQLKFKLNSSASDFENHLQQYKQHIRNLESNRQKTLNDFKSLVNQITFNLEPLSILLKTKNPQLTKVETVDIFRKNQVELKALEQKFSFDTVNDLDHEDRQITLRLNKIRQAELNYLRFLDIQKDIKQKQEEKLTKEKSIASSPQTITIAKKEIEKLELQLDNEEKEEKIAFLQKKLSHYREELQTGEPCPLCGSLDHPFANHTPLQKTEKNLIASLKEKIKHHQLQLTKQQAEFKAANENLEAIHNTIQTKQKELNAERQKFEELFSKDINQIRANDLKNSVKLLEERREELKKYTLIKQQQKGLKKAIEDLNSLAKLLDNGRAIKKQIEQQFNGENFENEIEQAEKQYYKLNQEFFQLKSTQESLKKEQDALSIKHKNLVSVLIPQLSKLGYKSVETAREDLLNHSEFKEYQERQENLKRAILTLETSLTDLRNQNKKLEANTSVLSLDELKKSLEEHQHTMHLNDESLNELNHVLKNQTTFIEKIEELQAEIKAQTKINKRWKIMRDLIGDATGNKFNDYAQDLTLSQLLILANKRLTHLTDRYKMDKPLSQEDDSLIAIDQHMGGQRRSIKTLSGGETFLMSLALALALSDLASHKVEINSLFIDEGFGTLDPETLDQTLDTLELLQAKSNKMIGIISHVTSLKERISTQIQINQNGQGYSSLKIIG
ncbi:AAA family ATPase [uncultured Mesonia sp.]|uniref:AAA family ATPase n=1 Tax=uncultured Mesonia sp. TaxID=399731 RepID=UPI00374E7441